MIAAGIAPASLLSRIDPRVRLLCVLASSLAVALDARPLPLGLLALAGLVLCVVARVPARVLLRRLIGLNAFMALVLLTLPLTSGGDVLVQIAGIDVYRDGLLQALRIVLAGHALVLLFVALVATLEPTTLAHALLHLKVPDKLVRILMFAIRYIDVLHDTRLRRERAMRARGFVARCDAHTLRTTAHLVGSLVGDSLERAQRIEQAMRARGWRGGFPMLHHFHLAAHDVAFGLFFAGLLLTVGVLA